MLESQVLLIGYFIIMLGLALFIGKDIKKDGYLVNNRKTSIGMLTLSTIVTFFGAGAFITVITESYKTGISFGVSLTIGYIIGLIILGLIAKWIRKKGKKEGLYTMPEFFKKELGMKFYKISGLVQILIFAIWASLQIIIMAGIFELIFGFEYHISMIICFSVVLIYSFFGGIKLDIITDSFQSIFIFFIILALIYIGFQNIGGIQALSNIDLLGEGIYAYGGKTMFFLNILAGSILPICNSSYRQRIMSAKNKDIATKSVYYSIPPIIVMTISSIIIGIFLKETNGTLSDNNIETLLNALFINKWILAIGTTSVLAIIMSSLDTILVSGASIVQDVLSKDIKTVSLRKIRIGIIGYASGCFLIAITIPNLTLLTLLASFVSMLFIIPIGIVYFTRKRK